MPPSKNHLQPHPPQCPLPHAFSRICFCAPSRASSHLLPCLCFPLSCPHIPPQRDWDTSAWSLFNQVKTSIKDYTAVGRKLALQLPRLLLSICRATRSARVTRVTPAPCISTKCHFKESKTKEVCCVGSDHQVQLIRSFPHRLPTKVLQPRDPFHAETAEKVFSQPGWCSILPPCLSSPSPPNIQAASKAVDGHIPQHSFPKSESTSTN